MTAPSTVRPDEQARFNALAATWWNPQGPMRPLHAVNALRLDTVVAQTLRHFHRPSAEGLVGLRVLDVGCGAGLMSEPLAKLGAQVLGVDAAERNVAIAQAHARAQGVASVAYRAGEPARVLADDERFDVILLLEVVEHVADVPAFVADALRHLAPGGLVIASTINRTAASFALAIVGAEWVMRLLPRGTHRWAQFVTPVELASTMAAFGLRQRDIIGMRYNPWRHRASWCASTQVNYLACYAPSAAFASATVPDRDLAPPPPIPAQEQSQ